MLSLSFWFGFKQSLFIAPVLLRKLGTFPSSGAEMLSQRCWPAHLSITTAIPAHVTRTNHAGNSCLMTHPVNKNILDSASSDTGLLKHAPEQQQGVCSLQFSQWHSAPAYPWAKVVLRCEKNIFPPQMKDKFP